ncbi:MAG: hypothetical protein VKL39_24280 [Leptolyngbyaceae bacterium]|nr:hypothetical protein [Leptolyngbyaceae bacterium]
MERGIRYLLIELPQPTLFPWGQGFWWSRREDVGTSSPVTTGYAQQEPPTGGSLL